MADTQTFGFEAEVRQLLDLVIHSLYSQREVFLRELVSNSSDALDRLRVTGLSRDDLRVTDDEPGISVRLDTEAKTITISDNGIGLTADEAREHLGTIARSGTKAFAAAIEDANKDDSLIGQFGVGFYSAYLVAEQVKVISKNNDDDLSSSASARCPTYSRKFRDPDFCLPSMKEDFTHPKPVQSHTCMHVIQQVYYYI